MKQNKLRCPAILFAFLLAAQTNQAQVRINEVLAINSTTVHDPDFGEFADFVELHNPGTTPVSLNGFSLTDNASNKKKWPLPPLTLGPGQYLVIWADGMDKRPGDTAFVAFKNATATMTAPHANFRLSGDGEYLGLFDPQGGLVDELRFGIQTDDVSFGRHAAAPAEWVYFGEPTPGAANSPYGSATLEAPGEPVFSLKEGFYPAPQLLYLSAQEPGAVVRFTFDGSTPNANSPVFSDSFPLNLNLCIKARLYVPGKAPGEVVTKSYFINENTAWPVLSISTNTENLYGFDFGILKNAIKEREVPATIEYFEPGTGERAFLAGVGLRVFGTTIYNLPQRPISVRFRSKYGDDALHYPLFEDKPITQYSAFLLRNGGNDYNTAFFRDGLATELAKGKMDLDYQDYKPCIVFINGAYNGIYELRERLDEQYIGSNHEIAGANLDYLEDSLQVVAGDQHAFAALQDFVQKNDLSQADAFAKVAAEIDLNEFCNYLIHRAFVGYQIADLNNRYWRNRDTGGKWRWIASDLEHGFGQLGGDPFSENTIAKLAGLSGHLPEWATLLFNRLLQNPGFRDGFIQRSAAYLNTIYQPSVTLTTVDSLRTLFLGQMPRHIGRWQSPPSMQAWQGNIGQIKTYLEQRPGHYRRHLNELFGKPDSAWVSMQIVGQGRVNLSGVDFPANMEGHFFKDAVIELQALPAPGHRFVAWQGLNSTSENTPLTLIGDTAFVAVFEPIAQISIIPPLIAADTTLAASASPWYGFEDVSVLPGARLSVEAGAVLLLTDGVCINVQGGLRLNGAPDQRISVLPDPSPSARRSVYGQRGFWGSITADDPTDSLIIRYADLRGGSFGRDRNRHFSSISTYNCPLWMEHSTISEGKAPIIARGGSGYFGHSELHTSISCNGFLSLYNMDAPIIEHCAFRGNSAFDTDAIDLKGITNAIVRHNLVSGFLGSNSDGIDLGIYCLNNLLEHNIIHDCFDKGISIGSQSNAHIRRNLIYDCDYGVALKDSLSVAFIDQNTFYGNRQAVACYEKSILRGGARAFVKNSIFSTSTESSIDFDEKSLIQVSYSLSDLEVLSGTGNLHADPEFIHPSTGNFQLAPNSPCIDSGDPFSPQDPDGSPADMGAYYTHTGSYGLSLHINEFNYHPPFNYPSGDWVELHNSTDEAIDLQGWSIAHGLQRFDFKENTSLHPGEYLVVCQDTLAFQSFHPDIQNRVGNIHAGFSNKSGKIALYNPAGELVHSVRYTDARPWPPLADGLGASVELSTGLQGNLPTDWRESHVLLGTPGAANSQPTNATGLSVNEVLASNAQTLPDEHGDFDDWFELYNATSQPLNIGGLCFTDNPAQPCKWQVPLHFPEKTTISPQGFLLVWADEQPGQGLLHADFKLSANGEIVAVFQRNDEGYEEVERLAFGPQSPDVSWGRYPDGSAEQRLMSPTPGSTNLISGSKDAPVQPLRMYPNPFSQQLHIYADSVEKPYRLSVANLLGQVVQEWGGLSQPQFVLPRGNLPSGMYAIVLVDAAGQRFVGKVVVER